MKHYIVSATLKGNTTSKNLAARSDETAIALAAIEVKANHVSDPRWAKGKIEVTNPDGDVVYSIEEEE